MRKCLFYKALAVGLCYIVLIGIFPAQSSRAETPVGVKLGRPDLSGFPKMSVSMEVYDPDTGFVGDLQAKDLVVLEDGKPVPGAELIQVTPGVQFVTAINPGSTFTIRDMQGKTRYDAIARLLVDWAQAGQDRSDDYSLLIAGGTEKTHLTSSAAWMASLEAYQPDIKNDPLGFEVLVKAIDTAADPTPTGGMKRAVLLITPPPEDNNSEAAFQSILQRANQEAIQIFVWVIASPQDFDSPGTTQLANLAIQTGGKVFMFSGAESLPNPEEYLAPMRNAYQLSFTSQLRSSGEHQLSVNVNRRTSVLASEPVIFSLNIAAPAPVFVSPTLEIVRTYAEDKQAAVPITPLTQSFQVMVEFPDGIKRNLLRTRLFVDGVVAQENTQAPLDSFTWDLSSYLSPGEHILRVEAEDELGMVGSSIETPVQIKIVAPKTSLMSILNHNSTMIAILAIILTGAVLGWVLVLGGKFQPKTGFESRNKSGRLKNPFKPYSNDLDPVTQPVSTLNLSIQPDQPSPKGKRSSPAPVQRLTQWAAQLGIQSPQTEKPARAFLTQLSNNGHGNGQNVQPFAIINDEVCLGSDKKDAALVVDDPSVNRVHARLFHQVDGTYLVVDQNTVAGTWVNYAPISAEGTHLQHGDLLHIGKVGFRFTYLNPNGQARKAVIRQN